MKLVWSVFAVADRNGIFAYIEGESPRAAVAIDDRIGAQVSSLLEFPRRGRPGRMRGTRELVIGRTPYIVAYRVRRDAVFILRVLHGAQMWPARMPEDPKPAG